MKRITYKDFLEYTLQNGYSEKETEQMYARIKSMTAESRKQFIDWSYGKGYPKDKVESVTVQGLIEECKLKPINAFIVYDWLKTEPQAAKYFMLKLPTDCNFSEAVVNEAQKFLNEKGYTEAPAELNTEDMTDE